MNLILLQERYAVCRLPAHQQPPAWASGAEFLSFTRTPEELSIVCNQSSIPVGFQSESGWRCFRVEGTLDFSLTGILLSIARPLADAGISIFAVSTYSTDYVLVKEHSLREAKLALQAAGHAIAED